MSRKEQMVWVTLVLACGVAIVLLFWNINIFDNASNNKYKKQTYSSKTKTKPTKVETIEKYRFYFHARIPNWVLPQYKNFWSKPQTVQKLSYQWTVGNYLDYYWPNWRQFYTIINKTLQRRIRKVNIIWYENKETIKQLKLRKDITLLALSELGITIDNLKIKIEVLETLLSLLRSTTTNWNNIVQFIRENFYQKEANKVITILRNNLWSFEWTDFYPEQS